MLAGARPHPTLMELPFVFVVERLVERERERERERTREREKKRERGIQGGSTPTLMVLPSLRSCYYSSSLLLSA